ncbi:MAG: glycogen/starch/alpha-glucan family phosphorylase [bacterium]
MKSEYFINKELFRKNFISLVEESYAIEFKDSSVRQQYNVLGEMIRKHIAHNWCETNKYIKESKMKQTFYFSMEFLMGRMISNNIMNSGVKEVIVDAFNDLGIDLNEIEKVESDAGLGNGGLGRLAACFMDSVSSLNLPVHGNCIRYRYGFFEQDIVNGYQVEQPDNWLKDTNVWEIRREEESLDIPFYGNLKFEYINNKLFVKHVDCEYVKAVPYDVPIIGNKNNVITTLRLWSAEASNNSDNSFEYNNRLKQISSMLYPNDETYDGKVLRLKQQYFFSASGVRNICLKHKENFGTLLNLSDYVCFHINDTHPVLIIPELMRILIDEESLDWDTAFGITIKCCAYTNHTILSEALEKWPIDLFKNLLPRIYSIVEEINSRLSCGNNKLDIINNGVIHMARLAVHCVFSVNGVAKLHTKILKEIEMKDFSDYYLTKFNNKTNGITHRRWLYHSNPNLVEVLNEYCGNDWVKNPEDLKLLLKSIKARKLQKKFKNAKLENKKLLCNKIFQSQGIEIDPYSIFDIQVKRLHEYKRQLLNALHIMYVYNKLKTDDAFKENYHPHTFIFGAKSAPSYHYAKKIIKLINTISDKVNNDNDTNEYLKVVFVINYNVSYAEVIVPACDISEQISTASYEASGTGNMKFMMNGAITLGTLDGANVEMKELVNDDIEIFGMNADEVNSTTFYNPYDYYNGELKEVIDNLTNGFFNVDKDEFLEIRNNLLNNDKYFVLKDFDAYKKAHENLNELYKDEVSWYKKSIMNTAMSTYFTTDRTIEEYNNEIWKLDKIKVEW